MFLNAYENIACAQRPFKTKPKLLKLQKRSWEFAHQEGILNEGQDSVDSPGRDKSHSLSTDLLFLIADEGWFKQNLTNLCPCPRFYKIHFLKALILPSYVLLFSLPWCVCLCTTNKQKNTTKTHTFMVT